MDEPEIRICIGAHQAPDFGIPAATVRSWAKRGKLPARGLDGFCTSEYCDGMCSYEGLCNCKKCHPAMSPQGEVSNGE